MFVLVGEGCLPYIARKSGVGIPPIGAAVKSRREDERPTSNAQRPTSKLRDGIGSLDPCVAPTELCRAGRINRTGWPFDRFDELTTGRLRVFAARRG